MNRNTTPKCEGEFNILQVVFLVFLAFLANTEPIVAQYLNSNLPPPPMLWKEHWYEHVENVTRVYLDDHVAGYLDQDVNWTVQWPFEYMSKVWRYVKNTYGYFGPDQHLYVILHVQKYKGGHASNYFRADHDRRNVIDFGQTNRKAWTDANNYGDIIYITGVAGFVVEDAAKQTSGLPAFGVSQYNWNAIFVYDVLLNVGMKKEAERFLKRELEKRENFPQEGTYWMRDWFLPIYQKYGGADVLYRFFKTLYFNYPRGLIHGSDRVEYEYKGQMSMGEFVHFWSGAAGENLRDLAVTAFNWTLKFQAEFELARIKFPGLKYKCDDCKEFPKLRPNPVV